MGQENKQAGRLNSAVIVIILKLSRQIEKQRLSDGIKKSYMIYMIYQRYTLNISTYRNIDIEIWEFQMK